MSVRPRDASELSPERAAAPGVLALGVEAERDALLYVPPGYRSKVPAPLVLLLHGAGGDADGGLAILRPIADAAGLVLLAPASRGPTWDVLVYRRYGPDVAGIDRALGEAFARCVVDPTRLAIGGFSDGASYALALGLANGDLFTHILAFSPGFMAPPAEVGRPRIYVSHGRRDRTLPIERCSRRIVPALRSGGYDVRYREFDGPHTVPPTIRGEAVGCLLG